LPSKTTLHSFSSKHPVFGVILMKNDIITKEFQGSKIRSIFVDGEPWFVAKDTLQILLDNKKPDVSNAIKDLDSDELRRFKIVSGGQSREMAFVSESGLYELIMRSRKPVAKPFQKWVTKEVLPSIRKTGSYTLSEPIEEPKDFSTTVERVLQKSRIAFELIEFVTEKKEYQLFLLDRLLKDDSPLKLLNMDFSNSFFLPTELGKMVGKSPVEINKILEFNGLQEKVDNSWSLTEKGRPFGIEIKGSFVQLKWRIEAIVDSKLEKV
jgi:prophage antirepressor-like protein